MKTRRILLIGLPTLLGLYIVSYMFLSSLGRYEPACIGPAGVKWYHWAPFGFVSDYNWNPVVHRVYLPLWMLDTRLWHTPDDAYDGMYPVNEVPPGEIGKVFRAWGAFDEQETEEPERVDAAD